MVMAKDDDAKKDFTENEDEDLLDFDFDEDVLGEEEDVIELVDVFEEGRAPEPGEEKIESLEELLIEDEKQEGDRGGPTEDEDGEETVLMKKGEQGAVEEGEITLDLEEELDLDAGFEELEGLEERVSKDEPMEAEPETKLDLDEEISLDEGIEELMTKGEKQTAELGEEEHVLDLEEEIKIGEEFKDLEEELGEEPELEGAVELEAPVAEEITEEPVPEAPPFDQEAAVKEAPIREEFPQEVPVISEEKIEAVLTRTVREVLERVAREVLPEVAERIIREEIDVLRKSIESEKQ
jgi:hypothetical protein